MGLGLIHGLIDHAQWAKEAIVVGDGAAATSTVHVDDLASLIQTALLHAPEGTTYMAASDEVLTWREIAQLVAHVSDPTTKVTSIPSSEADLLGLDGSILSTNCVIHDDGPRRHFGWRPTGPTLAEELAAAVPSS